VTVSAPTATAETGAEQSGLAVYEEALRDGRELVLRHDDGELERHDVSRWIAAADAVDRRVLARCGGPTIDLGCGPGRLAAALGELGVPALGVDVSRVAVAMARARGALAIRRDVLDGALPGEGRWACALLADGNVGIGGRPRRLLRRVAGLVARGGTLVVEVDAGDVDRRSGVRIVRRDGHVSRPFPWAVLGAPAVEREARLSGWRVAERWDDGGRRFVALSRL
jgi:SAM-dependent methyltransferase